MISTTPHTAPQLVQLRQSETLCVFDDHDGGIGHVNPNFDDRRCDKDVVVFAQECLHHELFLIPRHLPVHDPDSELREDLVLQRFGVLNGTLCLHFLTLFNERIHDICLTPLLDLATNHVEYRHDIGVGNNRSSDRFPIGR